MKGTLSVVSRLLVLLAVTAFLIGGAWAQNSVSGDLAGTVTDPSGAVVPGAKVSVTAVATGQTRNAVTGGTGIYHFALLVPGRYTVTVTEENFAVAKREVEVGLNVVSHLDVKLSVGKQEQVVEVNAEAAPQLQVENGDVQSNLNVAQIAAAPSAGGDITALAELTPGIQTSTGGGGYGNFSSNGVPANANLFTVNGNDDMDPFLNLNNSGSSNLTLGINELSETTVTTDGYSGEFGRQAGAQLNYTTKSGSNAFHGNAIYSWSGAAVNARDWFNTGDNPNTHDDQYAGSVGGPIIKNKLFFFVDFEGLQYKVPTSSPIYAPGPQFQADTLAALAGNPAQLAFYKQMFNLWNTAPGASTAQPYPTTADSLNGEPAGYYTSVFHNAVTSPFSHERMLVGRVDYQASDSDRVFFRVKGDHGFQPTWTDPINPVFNSGSTQPSYEGQANWTHTLSNTMVNQLILSGSWYTAFFAPDNESAALAAFPGGILPGGAYTPLGGENFAFPQGRNVSQAQVVDDFSIVKGRHSLKFGINYRHNNITDFDFQETSTFPAIGLSNPANFGAGNWDYFIQNFPTRSSQPFVISTLGLYAQDQVKVNEKLSLTLALRLEHNANPYCATDCFTLTPTTFDAMNHDESVPYNQALVEGYQNAFHQTQPVVWQPRVGFAYNVAPKTVIRGGFGLFMDLTQGDFAEYFAENAPNLNSFQTSGLAAPSAQGSAASIAAAANQAVLNTYNSGGGMAELTKAELAAGLSPNPTNAAFPSVTPNLYVAPSKVNSPWYEKYNLEIQQGIGNRTTVSINYVGTRGSNILIQNPGLNAWNNLSPAAVQNGATPVAGFSTIGPIDNRFGTVYQFNSAGTSSYNGLIFSVRHTYGSLQVNASYTWSHALDDVSNGGLEYYNGNSIMSQIDPQCLKCQNYGNADYDIRHYLQGYYTWSPKPHFGNEVLNRALTGWSIGNSFFFRTGLPFTIADNGTANLSLANATNLPGGGGGNAILLANLTNGPLHCGAPGPGSAGVCFDNTAWSPAVAVDSNQVRNQNRGPNYFDSDLTITKLFKVTEQTNLGVGLNAFNVLNHPNFAVPENQTGNPAVGTIDSTVSPPTSPFGSFAGAAASGRVLQLTAKVVF